MSVITLVVKKLMTNKLLNQTKFTRSDGTIKNGFEIYRILQTPQAGGVNNIVYLTRQIQNLEKKEWTGNYEYLQTKHNDLIMKRTEAIKNIKKQMEEIQNEIKQMNKIPFRSTLGSLSHITRYTRSDIMYATFYLSRHQKDPGLAHWKGLKRVLRYLKGTKDLKLKAIMGIETQAKKD